MEEGRTYLKFFTLISHSFFIMNYIWGHSGIRICKGLTLNLWTSINIGEVATAGGNIGTFHCLYRTICLAILEIALNSRPNNFGLISTNFLSFTLYLGHT